MASLLILMLLLPDRLLVVHNRLRLRVNKGKVEVQPRINPEKYVTRHVEPELEGAVVAHIIGNHDLHGGKETIVADDYEHRHVPGVPEGGVGVEPFRDLVVVHEGGGLDWKNFRITRRMEEFANQRQLGEPHGELGGPGGFCVLALKR